MEPAPHPDALRTAQRIQQDQGFDPLDHQLVSRAIENRRARLRARRRSYAFAWAMTLVFLLTVVITVATFMQTQRGSIATSESFRSIVYSLVGLSAMIGGWRSTVVTGRRDLHLRQADTIILAHLRCLAATDPQHPEAVQRRWLHDHRLSRPTAESTPVGAPNPYRPWAEEPKPPTRGTTP